MPSTSRYYFAWVGSEATGFDGSLLREDELIYSFDLKHDEGQFPTLDLEIANPRTGLLSPGRPLWAWFSWFDGSAYHPLFFGRLIGIPDDLFKEVIKIKLMAKSSDYSAQQTALAESLKYLPYYDPIFIDATKANDPNTVLEGRSALWHVDRISHQVTISDIITGEDGTVEFGQGEAFYDDVSMKLAGAPLLMCEIEAQVTWTQCDHTGVFEMKAVPNQGTVTKAPAGGGGGVSPKSSTPSTSTSQQPQQSKPEQESPPKFEQQSTYSWDYKNVTPGPHSDGDLMEESGSTTDPFYGGVLIKQDKVVQYPDKETGQGEQYSIKESYKYTIHYTPPTQPSPAQPETPPFDPMADLHSTGTLGPYQGDTSGIATAQQQMAVEVQQDRAEAVYVAMVADVQPVLVDVIEAAGGGAPSTPPTQKTSSIQSLSMSARDLVDVGVLTASDGAYFAGGRGQWSIEYLLMVCRAHLLAGSRVVEVTWKSPFAKVIGLSCRMNAAIDDPRLPGGQALGKIVSYEMTGDGDSGAFFGAVTINCAIGNAGSPVGLLASTRNATDDSGRPVATEGTPTYVDPGYVDGYQFYSGMMVYAATNDVTFSPLEYQAVGIQIPVTADQVLERYEYHDGLGTGGEVNDTLDMVAAQLRDFTVPPIGQMITSLPPEVLQYLQMSKQANDITNQVIQDNPSWVEIEFKPTKGISASANYRPDVGPLSVPKHIDLSA